MAHEQYPYSDPLPEHYQDVTGLHHEEKPGEECGIIGVFSPGEPVVELTYHGLHDLQHRGQNAAGIVTNGLQGLIGHKGEHLIDVAIPEAIPIHDKKTNQTYVILDRLAKGDFAFGHVRYATMGGVAQPIFRGENAFAMNGHVEMLDELGGLYGLDPHDPQYAGDTDFLAAVYTMRAEELGSLEPALLEVSAHINGAFSIIASDGTALYVLRDPWAHRPLSVGVGTRPDGEKRYVFASEPFPFKTLDVEYVRDVEQGEMLVIDKERGLRSLKIQRQEEMRRCMFEYIYFSRPESDLDGVGVYLAREHMGRWLYKDTHVPADIVVGVRESGTSAAIGYSKASGLFREEGLFKNPYIKRTFIEDGVARTEMIRRKQNPNRDVLNGQRVILVDDSLIKGNTMKNLVSQLRDEGGAAEVHVRLASPRYLHPCFMGMDTRNPDDLIARTKSDAEIAKILGADSVAFNSLKRAKQSITMAARTAAAAQKAGKLCDSCVSGEYPFPVPACTSEITNSDVIREQAIAGTL